MSRFHFCFTLRAKVHICCKSSRCDVNNYITAILHRSRPLSTSGSSNIVNKVHNSLLNNGVHTSSSRKLRRQKLITQDTTNIESSPVSSQCNTEEMKFVQSLKNKDNHISDSMPMKENVHKTYFGHVRFDESNRPSVSSSQNQIDRISDEHEQKSTKKISKSLRNQNSTIFDEQYFGKCFNYEENIAETSLRHPSVQSNDIPESGPHHLRPVILNDNSSSDSSACDVQKKYSKASDKEDHNAESVHSVVSKATLKSEKSSGILSKQKKNNKLHNSEFEDGFNYFDKSVLEQSGFDYKRTLKGKVPPAKNSYQPHEMERDSTSYKTDSELNYFDKTLMTNYSGDSQFEQNKYFDEDLQQIDKRLKLNIIKHKTGSQDTHDKTVVDESPVKAYDVVKKIRQEQKQNKREPSLSNQNEQVLKVNPWMKTWDGKTDSQGFKILEDQVMNMENIPQDILVTILKKSILYEDDNLVAINKPYGLPSHGGPGINNSIGKLLKQLAQRVDKALDTLYLVHRLDKESTGVMLLGKSAESTRQLSELFKTRQVIKKYLVLTKGVPDPQEGVIDIPLTEGIVEGKYRMTLKPRYSAEMKKDLNIYQSRGMSGASEAITNFKVLDTHGSAALVECQPETGVKHQIRCHLSFALNTPILGDHKYSHLSKIAPQKLYVDILQRLGIRQAKVRHLPMHLHASQLILPQFREGRNLFVTAKLPQHFQQNMKWLKLHLPK